MAKVNSLSIGAASVTDFIVERGTKDGWNYVVYNSGWKECQYKLAGNESLGNISINLPLTFADTNYFIQVTVITSGSSGAGGFAGNWWGAYPTSTTSINVDKQTHKYSAWIEVKGF